MTIIYAFKLTGEKIFFLKENTLHRNFCGNMFGFFFYFNELLEGLVLDKCILTCKIQIRYILPRSESRNFSIIRKKIPDY